LMQLLHILDSLLRLANLVDNILSKFFDCDHS
jgi:hypothetical protein